MAKKLYGLIGHPVGHSLSPAMHNAAFKSLGIDAEYRLYDVEPDELEAFLDTIKSSNFSGLNVTIPHKIAVKEYIERNGHIDQYSKMLGAVNTISIIDGQLKGSNTDGPGFFMSLQEDLEFDPIGKNVFILGAGGAATAIMMFLGDGPKNIFIYDVAQKKLADLKEHYERYYSGNKLKLVKEDNLKIAITESNLLINATPIGMKEGDPSPVNKNMLHEDMYVYDLVYNRTTQLVKEARAMKLHAITGLGMLLYQGAGAFKIWTGIEAPVDVMRKALKEALKV